MKISKYTIKVPYNDDTILLYSSLSHAVIEVPSSSIGENGEIYGATEDEIAFLNNLKMLSSENETQQMVEFLESRKENDKKLNLWIYFTSNCNLNCSYCYEKSDLSSSYRQSDMTFETIRHLVLWCKNYVKKNCIEEISITLTGGEPFLYLQGLEYFTQLLDEYCLTKICKFTVITNGFVITDEAIRFINNYCDTVQITLDGPEEIHNERRITRNNEGTFKVIVRNIIKIISKANITMIIRINVDLSNMDHIEGLIKTLDKYQLKKYVTVNFGDVVGEKNTEVSVLKKIISINDTFLNSGYRTVICETTPCPMSGSGWYAIAPNGDIYKCTGLIGKAEFSVGNVATNIYIDKLEQQVNMDPWKKCLDCEVVGICAGGCSYRDLFARNENSHICRKPYLIEVLERQIRKLV